MMKKVHMDVDYGVTDVVVNFKDGSAETKKGYIINAKICSILNLRVDTILKFDVVHKRTGDVVTDTVVLS